MSGKLKILILFIVAGLVLGMGGPTIIGSSSYGDPSDSDSSYGDPPYSDPSNIGSYIFPMEGSEFALSGTFGELRTNHFHSGIDVKTGGATGKRVIAARGGYIYRVKVSPYGFGKAIYLRHPDGEFTVYAHLKGFNDEVEKLVYEKQYASKCYEQEIYLPEGKIPVRKGQLIGYSGNSGSSGGPHLHFEIRDPNEKITNVLKHFRGVIRDNVPPTLRTIGIQPLGAGSRVDGRFEKLELVPEGSNGAYTIPGTIQVSGKFGIEYHAYDLLSAASNHCGINYVRVYLDDQPIYAFNLDTFSFDEKKFINVHFDYSHYKKTGRKFQRAYRASGNRLACYGNLCSEGVIELKDDVVHRVRLELRDTHLNQTTLHMRIKRAKPAPLPTNYNFTGSTSISGEVIQNVFVFCLKNPSSEHTRGVDVTFTNGSTERILPTYLKKNELVFVRALDKWGLPELVRDPFTGKSVRFHFTETILPGKNNIVESGELQMYFPYGAVFDSLPLHVRRYPRQSNMYSQVYEIGSKGDPLFKSFVLNYRLNNKIDPTHAVIARKSESGGWQFLGKNINEDGSIYASSGSFGSFCVMADSTPPSISPKGFSDGSTIPGTQNTLRIRIRDNFAGIDSDRIIGTLDDHWILFEFDAKTSTISHRLRQRPASGRHKLHLMVYDNANNLAENTFHLYF